MRALGYLVLVVAWSAAADPRFAAKPSWSYAVPANPPAGIASPSRDQMIEDVAYLEHALDQGWAWSSRSTIDSFKALPGYLEKVALSARDSLALCEQLARELRNTGIRLSLDGSGPCAKYPVHAGPGTLETVPANRNFSWKLERGKTYQVGVLTVSKFADPKDAGWVGLRTALSELAKTDLVIVDLQDAAGEDPRVGFAIAAALGYEDYDRGYLRPPMFRDTDLAKTARANLKSTAKPRSRTAWATWSTAADIKALARTVSPTVRAVRSPVAPRILIGPGCGRACQLVVGLIRWQSTLFGSFEDDSGDELGVIRLPHSGINVTFPTASYGPYILGPIDARTQPANYATTIRKGLHEIGQRREAALAWHGKPLPNCASLPVDRSKLRKISGCFPDPPPAKFWLGLGSTEVDAATLTRFLQTCNLELGTASDEVYGTFARAYAAGTADAMSQALGAPFEIHGNWGCEPKLD